MKSRIRIRFAKQGVLAFTGHLDIANLLPKLLRRCRLELAYSQGFSPRPKMIFTNPLPLGCYSLAEFCDVELTQAVEPNELKQVELKINEFFPNFQFIINIRSLADEPSISLISKYAIYEFCFNNVSVVNTINDMITSGKSMIIQSKEKTDRDLLPLIVNCTIKEQVLELVCLNSNEKFFPPLKFANMVCEIVKCDFPIITKTKLLDAEKKEIV